MNMQRKKRIIICEFHQESNTFNPNLWDLSRFSAGKEVEGPGVLASRMASKSMVRGMAECIMNSGYEVIPTIFTHASSGGKVDDAVLRLMKERVKYYIETVGEFDGMCVALHGATCTPDYDDACGEFLRYLRSLIGDKPMTAAFDLHANITSQILDNADFISAYHTYPHVDIYESGYRAASHCVAMLEGKKRYMASVAIPMLVPPAGYSTMIEPFHSLMNRAEKMVEDGKLVDFCIFPVQPWLDIPVLDSKVIAISEDVEMAKSCAKTLAEELFAMRDQMQPPLKSVDEIIDIAEANQTGKPVILVDAADSPNGGAVGDSPVVAMRLLERKSKLHAGVFIRDPKAVAEAFEAGVGAVKTFSIGAGYTIGMPGPLVAEGKVRSLHDGVFYRSGRASRGATGYCGKSAVIRFGGLDVLVCEHPNSSGDPQIFRNFGIEPTLYDLIVVKANTSFREPYSAISDLIYYADAPGAGASNLKLFQWKRIPKGMYPFDLPENYVLPEPVVK